MSAPHSGPALLVLTLVFAEDHVLLHQRGHAPYQGKWAAPGGFVQAGESLERAAVREVEEEVGLRLDPEQLLPHAVMSLPELNQVYVLFITSLEKRVPLTPVPPEALDARWVSEEEILAADLWQPAAHFDIRRIFDRVRSKRFEVYQQSDRSLRVISTNCEVTYLWRAPEPINPEHDPDKD